MGEITLDEIAGRHDLVLVDNCSLTFNGADHPRPIEIFNLHFPEQLQRFANHFQSLFAAVKRKENLVLLPPVAEEFKALLDIAEDSLRRKMRKKERGFANYRKRLPKTSEPYEYLFPILTDICVIGDSLYQRMRKRAPPLEQSVYEPLYGLTLMVAQVIGNGKDKKRIESNSRNGQPAPKQQSTVDEMLVAAAFSYAISGKRSAGIATMDRRISRLCSVLYQALTAGEMSPNNRGLSDALRDHPVQVYQEVREPRGIFFADPIPVSPPYVRADLRGVALQCIERIDHSVSARMPGERRGDSHYEMTAELV